MDYVSCVRVGMQVILYMYVVFEINCESKNSTQKLHFLSKLQSSELNRLIDYTALHMQQLLPTTVAQNTAGLSPLIDPVVRLLVTSDMKAELSSTKHKYVS